MSGARNGWRVTARSWAISRFRRSRLLPVGMADKQADAERLGRPLEADIIVFFGTCADSLYQLRGWYRALEALAEVHRVSCVFRDSRTAAIVRAETSLDCLTLARYGQLDEILGLSDVKLALYVNHDPVNFECLRFTSLAHVYLGHGDSDKGVSVSNQVKAYDWCFLAGQGALERTANAVMFYDAQGRSKLIGQPQLDGHQVRPSPDPGRRSVLYAPTWEASQPSVSYGSLVTHGRQIMDALSGTYRVIYRPHPLNGVIDPAYGAADAAIRERADRVDTDVSLEQSFADADLLITDVSAVTMNWLATGKPFLVTRPAVPWPPSKLMDSIELLETNSDIAARVAEHLASDPGKATREELTRYYLTDTSEGAATERFIAACAEVIDVRDGEWARLEALGARKP